MIVKGVLIDLGDTLAYLDEAKNREYEVALLAALKKHGYERHPEDLASALASIYYSSTKGELKTHQEFWTVMLRKLGIPQRRALIEALQDVSNSHADKVWKLYDKVPETLTILKEKYELALVSNCALGTDKTIHALGLAGFFSCIILSYQIGARKPDKRVYLEALKCLGLKAEECAFIADEISDLEGARETGMKTILIRQGLSTLKDAKNANFKPDFQISQISEVTKVL